MQVVSNRGIVSAASFDAFRQFYVHSRYADRCRNPGICDLTFGNPHEMPLSGLVEAIRHRALPLNKDWFAYKTSEPESQAFLAERLTRELSLPFEPADIALTTGAMAAIVIVYVLAHAGGRPSLQGLLLTGIAVSALASAGTSVLLVATEEFRVKTVLFWLAGGLEGRSWTHVQLAALFILAGVAVLALLSRPLDVLSLGQDEAASLGLPVHATRLAVFALSALVAGAATAVAGSVPFVGLMAPHALRPRVGPLARHLIPASFLGGAVLVVLADLAARTLSDRLDLPLGSFTAFVGAPYFLLALRASEGRT